MMRLKAVVRASFVGLVVATAANLVWAEKEAKKTINARDLLTNVEVIGDLGQPLGHLTTIRGTWQRVKWKEARAVFRVSRVDGMPPSSPVEFQNKNVQPIYSGGAPSTTKGIAWDWKARHNGQQEPPTTSDVKEGEEWEMIGAEKGYLVVGFSKQFTHELGGPWLAASQPGFHAAYTFIAVRRIRSNE